MLAGLDSNWMNRTEFGIGLKALASRDLVLEALIQPQHLNAVAAIAQKRPDLRIIINHAAKVYPTDVEMWEAGIDTFALLENTYCKISGLTQQSNDLSHQRRIVNKLLDVFGADRLMWGSDFPVLNETANYPSWVSSTATLLSELSADESNQIHSGTAVSAYRLGDKISKTLSQKINRDI